MITAADSLPAGLTVVEPVTHYQVEGDRYWDISNAAFVDTLPKEFKLGLVPDRHGHLSIAGLKDALMAQGQDLGTELQNSPEEVKFYAQRATRVARFKSIAEPDKWMSLTTAQQLAWVGYYDTLMDLPNQTGFPWDGDSQVPWPTEPSTDE